MLIEIIRAKEKAFFITTSFNIFEISELDKILVTHLSNDWLLFYFDSNLSSAQSTLALSVIILKIDLGFRITPRHLCGLEMES